MKLCDTSQISCVLGLVILLACVVDSSDHHFCGGTISFEIDEYLPDQTKISVNLDVFTGWVLGKGPCGPNCTINDVGSLTNERRHAIEADVSFGPSYFGRWISEQKFSRDYVSHLTNSSEKIVAINNLDRWEQEWMQAVLVTDKADMDLMDLILVGSFWHEVTFQGVDLAWNLQTKIRVGIRNDTSQHNKSPKVLHKPIYRVRLDAISKLVLAAVDPEGDLIRCRQPFQVEITSVSLGDNRTQHNIQLLENCSIIINASRNAGFTDDMWFIYAVSMRDYNTMPLEHGPDLLQPYSFSLSTVPIQFLVHVVAHLDTPEFIQPTLEKGHEFVVFIGASWSTSVYAKPPHGRTIAKFEVQTRSMETIETTGPFDITTSTNAKGLSLFWTPKAADVGPHIVCIRALDNTGMDTQTDERCFKIHVADNLFTASNGTRGDQTRPYFLSLPGYTGDRFICPQTTTCAFPVIVHSNGLLDHIEVISESDHYIKGNITSTGHTDKYSMDFRFTHGSIGDIQTCFLAVAVNGKKSPISCFNATILGPDPCTQKPCENQGKCIRGKIDTTSFTCSCVNQYFFGKDCRGIFDLCSSSPCQNGARCASIPHRGLYFCICQRGYTGKNCEFKIDTCQQDECGSTGYHGICISNGTDSSCQCYPRYSGLDCSSDACPGLLPGEECPVSSNSPCAHNNCNNNGICEDDGSCVCQLGYTGPVCANEAHVASNSLHFVEPTIREGNLLVCYHGNNQTQPCTFRVFVWSPSGAAPNVTLSQGTGTLSRDSQVGSVLPDTPARRPKTFMADITLNGTKANGRNQVCVAVVDSNDVAVRCVEINFKTNPKTSNITREYKQSAKIRFVDPSPLSDSKFSCNVNQSCYLMLYTEKLGQQCLNIPTPRPEFAVYDPVTSSQCVTEISYRFVKEEEYFVCIQSELQFGEDRCYTFYIYNGNDPCEPSPCANRGLCGRNYLQSYCICPDGLTGDMCDKDTHSGH